ncbi:MAG TPA: ROK family protein [Steroidobacteraceae bacterium]|nr:ROK family protein [Steroidobacteraceae bacterium]
MTAAVRLFAGIELGGTKCVCLLASGPDAIIDDVRIPTVEPAGTLRAIAAIIRDWQRKHSIAALGIASFGPLERNRSSPGYGQMLTTPKPGWSGIDLLAPFGDLGLPVELDTDVNGAALAEARWGAAQGLRDFAYITVGTGIGVGTILDGRPVGQHAHSEAGHMRVGRLPGDDWPGACPFHGDCVEGLASGPAIEARTGRPPESLADDDPVWGVVAHALAALCHNLTLTVVPARILLGGGIALGRPALVMQVQRLLEQSLGRYAQEIVGDRGFDGFVQPARLGQLAGPLGAVALAMRAAGR